MIILNQLLKKLPEGMNGNNENIKNKDNKVEQIFIFFKSIIKIFKKNFFNKRK